MAGNTQPLKPARRLVRVAAAVVVASALAVLLFVTQSVWGSPATPTDEVAYQVSLQIGTDPFQYDLPSGISVTLPISVMVAGPQPLAAASVLIRYDPAVLRPIQCVARPGAPPGFCNANFDPQNGLVRFNLLSESGVMGEAWLFDLTFEVVALALPGDLSPVTPLIESLADPFGNYMTSRAVGSNITVIAGTAPDAIVSVGTPLQGSSFTVSQGLTTTVPIWITNVTRLGSASFSLAFDPAVVRPLACHPLVPTWDGDASGLCMLHGDQVRASLLSTGGLSGSVLAFEVVFTTADGAKVGSQSILDLTVEALASTTGTPIPAGVRDQVIRVVTAGSSDVPLLRLEPVSQELIEDARSTVHVFLDQATALRAATWNIEYDPAVLLAESCQLSPGFTNSVCNATGEPGVVRMSLLSTDPLAAAIDIAVITFRRHPEAQANQQSSLTFDVTNFADLAGNLLPYRSEGAAIRIRRDLTPSPGVVVRLTGAPPGGFGLALGASLDLPIAFDIDPTRPVGSLTGRLQYDPTVLRPTQCIYPETPGGTDSPMGYCNAQYDHGQGIVRFNLLSSSGVSGTLIPFTMTVEAASGATDGQKSNLDLSIETATGPLGDARTWWAEDSKVVLQPPVVAPRVLIGPPGPQESGTLTVTLGYTGTVAVWVEAVANLGAATLSLGYDPAVVRAVKCSIRSDLVPQIAGGFCAPEPTSGTLRANVVMQQGFSGTGHFYDVVFAQAPNVGGWESTPLTVTVENFVSIAEIPIPTTVRNGQLIIDTGLILAKGAAESAFEAAGDLLHYNYVVTNDGLAPLHGPVMIADNKVPVSCPDVNTIGNHDAYLNPGESITCTATYTVQPEDVTTRSVTNTAAATVDGIVSNQDSATVNWISPTSITVSRFLALAQSGQAVVDWETKDEPNIAGYNVLRKASESVYRLWLRVRTLLTLRW